MRKNLLIGAIVGYPYDIVAPFCNSFVKAGFENCDCVIFTGNVSKRTINKIKSLGIQVLPIPDELMKYSIINTRWKMYYDFLKNNYDKYDMVLAADVRDVFFQRDFFRLYNNDKPFLTVAVEDSLFSNNLPNKEYILNAYGEDIYHSMEHERIICVGTVWGTTGEFLKYAQTMSDILNSEWSRTNHIIEQAVGNYIIYHDKMFADVLNINTNYDGYVMNLGSTPAQNVKLDSSGNVLNGNGERAAVVHQYDQIITVRMSAAEKYSNGMLWIARKAMTMKRKSGFCWRVLTFMSYAYWNGVVDAVKAVMLRIKRKITKKPYLSSLR